MAGTGQRRVAAIDCGTNSLRLLIADVDPARNLLIDLHRRMEIVRLGEGVDATGRLAPQALARTFAMLEQFARTIGDSGATAVRLVATSATRDASNAAEFTAGVQRILGVDPEVVTGAQEAQLSFSGATAELSRPAARPAPAAGDGDGDGANGPDGGAGRPEPPFLVVDIGGGSTEFVTPVFADIGTVLANIGSAASGPLSADRTAQDGDLAAISVDVGCVRLTERYLHDDPPGPDQVAAARQDIDRALADVAKAIPVASARTLVGLAGSVTTVAAVALDLPFYDSAAIHHARVSAGRVHEVTELLLGSTRAQRAVREVIHPGRVDVIAAGALILDEVMRRFGFAEMVASEHDILDGIAWSMVTRPVRPRP